MRKSIVFLFVLIVFICSYGIDHISTTYTAVPGAVVSSSGLNANRDTLRNGINRVIDTMDNKFTRLSCFVNHGTTFNWMNIDTIGGLVRFPDTVVMGTIGMGTSTPTASLEITSEYFNMLANGASNQLYVTNTGVASGVTMFVDRGDNLGDAFRVDAGTISNAFIVKSTGYIGINKSSPAYWLDIKGSVNIDSSLTVSNKVKASYFTTNNEDSLVYEDTTFSDTLYESGVGVIGTTSLARIIRIGNQVTLYQPSIYGTFTHVGTMIFNGIPTKFLPSKAFYQSAIICSTGVSIQGMFSYTATKLRVNMTNSDYLPAGSNMGIFAQQFTWTK